MQMALRTAVEGDAKEFFERRDMEEKLKIAVVGAGLGGLVAALSLQKFGFDVTVIEQAAELGEVGAGVQVAPNATKVLRALGLESAAMKLAFEPQAHVIRSWKSGEVLARTPYKGVVNERFGAGYFGFHRADLHAVLAAGLSGDCVRLGEKCVGIRREGERAVVLLEGGKALSFDLVVGADGIHSVVRESMFGAESPRFTGNVCWRGMVEADQVTPGAIQPDMTVWFGPGAHVVHYYVRGGKLINWVASFEADDWRTESWRTQGNRDEMMARFEDWHPVIRELLGKSRQYFKWALFDRDPLTQWTQGPVTLLGDAAHPMLPYLAQGACMAMEDGYALALCLQRAGGKVSDALKDYEQRRHERTARVQLLARQRAVENHLKTEAEVAERDARYARLRDASGPAHTYGIDWIYEHDVTVP
ncbi:MAG: FAD-dependent monooxygenase [Burkholderiaceae bacterium]|nr:FAD-dependent monooxygenase [Desulfobacterales bacterium]MDP3138291.1 FAD-dependent monooxygenase [Burkholderiaceae bacterium]